MRNLGVAFYFLDQSNGVFAYKQFGLSKTWMHVNIWRFHLVVEWDTGEVARH